MRPLGFRIWDFKSIRDSGFCSLSEDGITAIAGQNESGKTSLLTALRDFDLEDGLPPETPDYFPDEDSENRSPRAGVKFEISAPEIDTILGASQQIPEKVRKKIVDQGSIWIYRCFSTGTFSLAAELKEAYAVSASALPLLGCGPNIAPMVHKSLSSRRHVARLRVRWPSSCSTVPLQPSSRSRFGEPSRGHSLGHCLQSVHPESRCRGDVRHSGPRHVACLPCGQERRHGDSWACLESWLPHSETSN